MKRYWWIGSALAVLLVMAGLRAGNRNVYQLPEERGTAGALAALEKLPVYVRVLQTTAHPDDESAGTLTWLSRKFHATTALFCLTRGEGGQNIIGNEKYQALGLVRTGELLEASKYYGVELYFGSVVDFGFSKTAEETLTKWGHEAALEDMVRFIRQWRPTIVISQFQGNAGDGHGHHQAAGILTREAFHAACDPQKFPDQIKQGLHPWQAKKLYTRSRGWASPSTGGEKGALVQVPVGDYDPVLGRSYREIGSEGYSKHRTQGDGTSFALPGRASESYELMDSITGNKQNGNSFFDSIDTSLMAIWELVGDEKQSASFLREDLSEIQKAALEALDSYQVSHPEKCASAVARGARMLGESLKRIEVAPLSNPVKEVLAGALNEKFQDFQKAVQAVLGIYFVARTEDATAVPGEKIPISLALYNRGAEKVAVSSVSLSAQKGRGDFEVPENCLKGHPLLGGDSASCRLAFDISPKTGFTEPFWYLESRAGDRYSLRPTLDVFAPFGPPEITAEVRYLFQGIEFPVHATAMAQAGDPLRGPDFIDFQIVPEFSVALNPGIVISPAGSGTKDYQFQVSIMNNSKNGAQGRVKLTASEHWHIEPAEMQFSLSRKGESFAGKFLLQVPSGVKPGSYFVDAVAASGDREFYGGYQTISYPENWTRNLYSRAQTKVEIFDIKVAPNLTVGYIPGAGDEIPTALGQLGIKTQILTAADLAFGDLNRFSTIITGIRAYNVNEDLSTHNQRLLNYVAQGGTLIVQYVRPMGRPTGAGSGSPFLFGPYPMSVSDSDRITVEDSPIRILDPANPVFNYPNKISENDFKNWVQERGLYFMNSWDERYAPLLSGNDPGEPSQNGGLLYAQYGKGRYIYTGYSWFRQLPAGNQGAFRIFANMISLGHR
jgi:LmbE family N-acetylglucosaminyl deacetylase